LRLFVLEDPDDADFQIGHQSFQIEAARYLVECHFYGRNCSETNGEHFSMATSLSMSSQRKFLAP
jgi:hypothetical protein